MDQIDSLGKIIAIQKGTAVGPTMSYNHHLFKQCNSESRKNKDVKEAEKLIRRRMRELPRDTELFVVESQDGMFNGVYTPNIKVKKITCVLSCRTD
jgi:hypothetical protein